MKSKNLLPIAVLMAGVLIAGTVALTAKSGDGTASIMKDGKEYEIVALGEPITITVLSDSSCVECGVDKLLAHVAKQIAPQVAVRNVEASSEEGEELIGRYKFRYLPTLLFDKDLKERDNFTHLMHHVVSRVGDGVYMLDLEKTGMPVGRYLGIDYYTKEDSAVPHIVLDKTEYDFGDVSQAKGNTATVFTVKNDGEKPLTITNMVSSCMCTTAQLEIGGEKSPVYGMPGHGAPPQWSGSINPGGEAKLTVFYDPNAHKDLRGAVTRVVTISTNDPINPESKVKINLNQIP